MIDNLLQEAYTSYVIARRGFSGAIIIKHRINLASMHKRDILSLIFGSSEKRGFPHLVVLGSLRSHGALAKIRKKIAAYSS